MRIWVKWFGKGITPKDRAKVMSRARVRAKVMSRARASSSTYILGCNEIHNLSWGNSQRFECTIKSGNVKIKWKVKIWMCNFSR